jgi:hypothetical protein
MPDPGMAGGFHPSRANRQNPAMEVHTEAIPEELADELLALPSHHALISRGQCRAWQRWYPEASVLASQSTLSAANHKLCEASVTRLDVDTFITILLCHDHRIAGRLYRTMWRIQSFDAFDVDFPLQVIKHAIPAIHNICRVDCLALDAAEAESQGIAMTFTAT